MLLVMTCAPVWGVAQSGDFLTKDEVDAVRDAQEPEKRIRLFLEIAEIRLGAIRAAIAAVKSGAGRTAQKKMTEYTEVLEALETTIAEARSRRTPFPKAMELLKQKLPAAKQFLESLDNESSPLYADYQFTLDEALDVTEEVFEDIEKGMFPEVDERTAPNEFPSAPPRTDERRRPPSAPATGEESGPPRKPGASSAPPQSAPPQSPEEGPPRKSDSR
jgi:hypothetical protein